MEVVQRCKNGTDDETHLISASATEVNGEPCVISWRRDQQRRLITDDHQLRLLGKFGHGSGGCDLKRRGQYDDQQ